MTLISKNYLHAITNYPSGYGQGSALRHGLNGVANNVGKNLKKIAATDEGQTRIKASTETD
jgi:hypothetical protein